MGAGYFQRAMAVPRTARVRAAIRRAISRWRCSVGRPGDGPTGGAGGRSWVIAESSAWVDAW